MTEQITDHEEQAKALFIDQYKDKPRLAALLSSYITQIQSAEDILWGVILQRDVDTATGDQLDKLGRLVGQPRRGLDDDTYRVAIKARIRANGSLGHPNDIIETAQLALSMTSPSALIFYELYPASWIVDAIDPVTIDARYVADVLRSASPAGVGGHLHFSEDDEDDTFCFADADVEQASTDRGFGDLTNTAGGKMIGAF